ncbi:unnamed protein product [Lactuca saligna]|uniref:Uncharacterized protein n=1 Tax=Lactuca saligna TaxID=75948 RepID=A0AA36A1W4_LACSI|nr:unnamed protein product [Lactuca saligna]
MIYGDGEDEFAGFNFCRFTIRIENDDESPDTRGQLKIIQEKLDSLHQASKPSSTDEYSQATVKSLLETLTKEHSTNLEKMNKVVDNSATVCNKTTKKVNKLISDATTFMNNFQTSFELNTTKATKQYLILAPLLKLKGKNFKKFIVALKIMLLKVVDYLVGNI